MNFRFNQSDECFRQEVRSFLSTAVTPGLVEELRGWVWVKVPDVAERPKSRDFARKLGARKWLSMGWPEKYGGMAGTFMQDLILEEELAKHRVRIPNRTSVRMIAPMILRFGSEEQKAQYLPGIAWGETEFALGYTEPQAGSDLASLEMRAVERDDHYVISGQKVFNTSAHLAHYHWLATRTDFNGPKHKGISTFIVDLRSPGITIRPIWTMAGGRTNEVFYDDVKVPKKNMVGEKNKGWYYMVAALDRERVTLLSVFEMRMLFDQMLAFVRQQPAASLPASTRAMLADLDISLEVARLLSLRVADMIDRGCELKYESASTKIFLTELAQKLINSGMRVSGLYGQLCRDSARHILDGRLEEGYTATVMPTFGGGTSEILRTVVATRGLGLPVS